MKFKWQKEYESYMNTNFPKNAGIYDRLTDPQRSAIMEYFRWRTKEMFNQVYSNSKLTVNKTKTKKLLEITGGADDWTFDGIVDLGRMCGKCTLGHPLRYEYHAKSNSARKKIIFGSTCASDFFDIAPEMLKRMDATRKEVFEEVRKLIFVHYTGKTSEFAKDNYPNFPLPMLKDKTVNDRFCAFIGSGAVVLHKILSAGLPIPIYFIEMIEKFYRIENRNKKIFSLLGHLTDEEKVYVMNCINNPDTFKPNKYIHTQLGVAVERGIIGKEIDDKTFKEMAKTGIRLVKAQGKIKECTKEFKADEYKDYDVLWFVRSNGNLVPAYKNQIDDNVAGLVRKYACMLPDEEWEELSSVLWCCKGGDVRLKNALKEARAKSYYKTEMYSYSKLLGHINRMLDRIESDKYDLRGAIDKQTKYVLDVKTINSTINEDIDTTPQVDTELDMAWNYLQNNKYEVKYDAILNMLSRYKDPSKLSEKQAKFMLDVYRKMASETAVVSNQPAVLVDNDDVNRIFVHVDSNLKRCAIIASNDACRPKIARKYMTVAVQDMASIVDEISGKTKIVYVDSNSRQLVMDILYEYCNQKNTKLSSLGCKASDLASLVGAKTIDSIKSSLGFDQSQMKKYARSIFKEEGVIDTFLEDTTAIYLELRRVIRENCKVG